MREDYEIKELNTTYKMSTILSIIMIVVGGGMLASPEWKMIFYGVVFILGGFVLVGIAIWRKRTLNVKLTNYLKVKLKEHFSGKNGSVRFAVERKKKIKYSYIIYVNGYVNKTEFELFMQNFKQELGIKMEHRLLRKPASSIK
jgi:ABC-type bacteriocin/lantibiotic exporter with double-glycine peptidase domain